MKDPLCGMQLDKTQAERERQRALATWLESQDAVIRNVLTSVLKSVFRYHCLNLTKQFGPICLTSKVILGLLVGYKCWLYELIMDTRLPNEDHWYGK